MTDYERLTTQYAALSNPGQRASFIKAHPQWWANYQVKSKSGGKTDSNPNAGSTNGQPVPGMPGMHWEDGKIVPDAPISGGTTPPPVEGEEEGTDTGHGTPPPNVPGYKWVWDEETDGWKAEALPAEPDLAAQDSLRAELRSILDQFGLATQGNITLLEQAVREDWSPTKFMQELRQSADYLANPLFAANVKRAATGKGFMPEGQVIAYATEAKRLAKQFGYKEPSDNYIAMGFESGLSLSEYEHRFGVQQRVNTFGAGVSLAYKQLMGVNPSDEDLYEIFDKEISTSEFDEKARRAEYMGRPLTLGLGIRTEAEARAAEMMGINPDEWFSRFENVSQNASRFERLRTIEDTITQGLPSNFGEHLATAENGLLIQALVFQRPDALAKLQDMTAREVARFKTGGGATPQQGQLISLLSQTEKQSFG